MTAKAEIRNNPAQAAKKEGRASYVPHLPKAVLRVTEAALIAAAVVVAKDITNNTATISADTLDQQPPRSTAVVNPGGAPRVPTNLQPIRHEPPANPTTLPTFHHVPRPEPTVSRPPRHNRPQHPTPVIRPGQVIQQPDQFRPGRIIQGPDQFRPGPVVEGPAQFRPGQVIQQPDEIRPGRVIQQPDVVTPAGQAQAQAQTGGDVNVDVRTGDVNVQVDVAHPAPAEPATQIVVQERVVYHRPPAAPVGKNPSGGTEGGFDPKAIAMALAAIAAAGAKGLHVVLSHERKLN